jgi:hypothetical protein
MILYVYAVKWKCKLPAANEDVLLYKSDAVILERQFTVWIRRRLSENEIQSDLWWACL